MRAPTKILLLFALAIAASARAATPCTPPQPAGIPCTSSTPHPTLKATPTGATTWSSGTYLYDGAGNIYAIGDNNYYVYDGASRLTEGTPAYGTGEGTSTHQAYSYDQYGNMTALQTVGTTAVNETLDIQAATNHLMDDLSRREITDAQYRPTYDSAGNMVRIAANFYSWDALDSMVSGPSEQYVYDANDERIATIQQNGTQTLTTYTLRGPDQKVLRELTETQVGNSDTWTWQRDYVYRDDLLLAQVLPGEITRHFHLDHLGSPRIATDASGNRTSTMVYWPFGADAPGTTHSDASDPMRFTGHEKVADANGFDLYYMHARYELARKGRFLSVDPTWSSADAGTPQSWNRYSYVLNNPVLHTDPDGRCSPAVIDCVVEVFVVAGSSGTLESFTVGLAMFTGAAYMTRGGGSGMCCESPRLERHAQNVGNYFSERYAPKDKDGNPTPLPTDKHGNATPDPAAEGRPHTQLGTRAKPTKGEAPYPQSRTWDGKGRGGRRIDHTDHNDPKNHPNPHQHVIDPNGKEHGPEPVPEIPPTRTLNNR